MKRHLCGFTLIELAVAVFVMALLLGSVLVPLATQIEQRRGNETRRLLDEIREALIGFAVLHGRLPCPTTTTDPSHSAYGVEDGWCTTPAAEGYLPWKTLGVAEMDVWGIRRTEPASAFIGYWRYRVDRNFASPFTLTTSFSADSLSVRDSAGNALTTTTERPVAIVFSTGPNTTPDGQNASFESTNGTYQADVKSPLFDDILIWISRPLLFNRMVTAGKLP